ncbi:uncharacterized protein CTRU02_211676 [Colletotrichum truncatum]|uniref:Uncharacterized protein n=1 Tax=Colletotrichum truncatum TaxID=5467 RepID=A0ACC3YLE9_COLTU|nr:uncharacterized protein CTRU02_15498 [Colletotrichum truncatum]XP_036575420.1 uncharacterized protein CTRU02_14664 [Colletotrichum truncatum]KAF6780972.1 hypothetical protein CTRU02_15498 [Colletotrichum truncatum]KAF6781983.1 hypothetical protein CTRU02_14664 [Colletotrichum truncatum]
MASYSDYNDIKASAKENAAGVYAYGQRQIDRVVSYDTRQKAYSGVADFAQERPLLFAFILSQLIFSSLPILVFSVFAISTIVFALGAAVIFALFWIGVAMLLLVPVLFFTCTVAILVWVWAASSFLIARWLYEMASVGAKGDQETDLPNKKGYAVTKHENGNDSY